MSPLCMLSFTHTRFKNKETKETAYLLDRALGLGAHARMSDGVKAANVINLIKNCVYNQQNILKSSLFLKKFCFFL